MREFGVFVPFAGERVAAVLTVPDDGPRGLMVFSPGPFAPRSHRFQVWALAAQRLAEHGIASIRWDYPGLHDSTGSITEIGEDAPVAEAMAVARFAMAATGVDRMVAAGNCYGAHASLALTADLPECVGAFCILPECAQAGPLKSLLRRAGGRKVGAFIRSRPMLARMARPIRRFDVGTRRPVATSLEASLTRASVIFVYDEAHLRTGPTDFTKIEQRLPELPESSQARFELRVLAPMGLDKFRSVDVQRDVLTTLVAWARDRLESPAEERSPMSLTTNRRGTAT
jgi:pimeloyl-ACP methyl ester carboxylesterase